MDIIDRDGILCDFPYKERWLFSLDCTSICLPVSLPSSFNSFFFEAQLQNSKAPHTKTPAIVTLFLIFYIFSQFNLP